MAKKSSGSRSNASSEPSNTGLIVTLVFFILATIGLGVTTYMGYGAKADAENQAKAAASKATDADKKASDAQAKMQALKIAVGSADASEQAVATQVQALHTGLRKLAAQIQKTREQVLEVAGKADTGAAPKSVAELLAQVGNILDLASKTDEELQNLVAKTKEQAKAEAEGLKSNLKTSQDDRDKANAQLLAVRNDKYGESEQKSAEIKKLSEENKKLQDALNDTITENTRQVKKLRDEVDTSRKVRQQLAEKYAPILEKLDQVIQARPELRDLADLRDMLTKVLDGTQSIVNDAPKGKIVETKPGLVYIDLGSADNVRTGLTFSVLPAGSTGRGAAAKPRKGAIEIVNVMEAHLSAAKVVEANNQARDPLLHGDLLFNPAWDPTAKVHVALAGIIDLNGSGVDGTQDLIRALEKQNVVVDAWIDVKDRTIKGPGITERTTYLIKGERPALPPGMMPDANPLVVAMTEVIGKITEMEAKARDLGVPSVQYRRFLTLIGYKLPRAVQPTDYSASSYLRGSTATKPADKDKDDKPK